MYDRLFLIRIFHLIVASVLVWGAARHLYEMSVPQAWYITVLALGVLAFLFHGYNLIVSLKPAKKKRRKHK